MVRLISCLIVAVFLSCAVVFAADTAASKPSDGEKNAKVLVLHAYARGFERGFSQAGGIALNVYENGRLTKDVDETTKRSTKEMDDAEELEESKFRGLCENTGIKDDQVLSTCTLFFRGGWNIGFNNGFDHAAQEIELIKASGSASSELHEQVVERQAYELAVHRKAKEIGLTDGDAEKLIDGTVKDYFPKTIVKPADFSK